MKYLRVTTCAKCNFRKKEETAIQFSSETDWTLQCPSCRHNSLAIQEKILQIEPEETLFDWPEYLEG